jgi:hypothetical protein
MSPLPSGASGWTSHEHRHVPRQPQPRVELRQQATQADQERKLRSARGQQRPAARQEARAVQRQVAKRDEFGELLLSIGLELRRDRERMGITLKAARRHFDKICKSLGPQAR